MSVTQCAEDMVLAFMRQLEGQKIELSLADRTKDGCKAVKYPRKCQGGSARPLAQIFRVLDLAQEAVSTNVPATKRDIYYRDVPLFKSQRVVDTLVDDLAATFQLERSDLNIRSSSKGLVCGSALSITLSSDEILQSRDGEASLIPTGEDIECLSVNLNLSWILVVEKEAVFQTLCQLQLCCHPDMPGPGLLITGKGYPDLATRHLLKSLGDALPKTCSMTFVDRIYELIASDRVPIVGLFDADPYGLDILSVYKYGSQKMQHENGKLATSRLKWLGLWASELADLGADRSRMIPITRHDEKKAMTMLREHLPARWKKELQKMLHSRRKAEIEILSSDLLLQYLASKVCHYVQAARSQNTTL